MTPSFKPPVFVGAVCRGLCLMLLVLSVSFALPALADEADAEKPAKVEAAEAKVPGEAKAPGEGADKDDDRNVMGMKASADGLQKENLPGWPFLYGAYSVIWLLIFGYIGFMWFKQMQISRQIGEMDRRLDSIDQIIEDLEKS